MIAILAVAGLVAGAALPWLIARIPDREPAEDEPRPTPYRELASMSGLRVLLAAGTAAAWALLGVARDELDAALPAYLVVAALGTAMVYVDIREHRLPDWLTFPALGAAAGTLAVVAGVDGAWDAYARAWSAAAVSFAFFLILALLRPSDLGLGDVKLAAVTGLLLGWLGWPMVLLGVFGSFLIGGAVGVALLIAGRAGRSSAIPFGPPMLLATLVVTVWGDSIADTYFAF